MAKLVKRALCAPEGGVQVRVLPGLPNKNVMEQPVIFLDFDGVLNTEQYQARLAIEGKPKKDAWGPLFDPRAVANLQKIVEATDAPDCYFVFLAIYP